MQSLKKKEIFRGFHEFASFRALIRSRRSRTCIFYINKNQVYLTDSIKCPPKYPTLTKRILQVSVPRRLSKEVPNHVL